MLSREMIESSNPGTPLLYRGENHKWYSGIVQEVGRYNGKSYSEAVGFLDVQPTDARLSGSLRKLWDSTGVAYVVPEVALTGHLPTEELRGILEAATPRETASFYVMEIMQQLDAIRTNYTPIPASK